MILMLKQEGVNITMGRHRDDNTEIDDDSVRFRKITIVQINCYGVGRWKRCDNDNDDVITDNNDEDDLQYCW
jgi:hypothetical protein